jgi:threonine dehydrogenase-like Zn-dependent dehydrogenase
MKVLKLVEPEKFVFEDRPMPIPNDKEVLLKMRYCGICGSDVRVYHGKHPYAEYPRIMGHEISADFNGENVSVNPYSTCGFCEACLSGNPNRCMKNKTMGVQRDGAYAEYITVPKNKIIENKYNLDPRVLALTEPFGVALHAINRAKLEFMDRVMIFGAGPIGAMCSFILANRYAMVHVVDPHDFKLNIAKLVGAKDTVNARLGVYNYCNSIIGSEGFDICIDASGGRKAISDCFKYIKTGGQVILIGHSTEEIPMPHSDIIKKELTILASRNSTEFEKAQEEMSVGKDIIKKVITQIVPFKEVPDFFKEMKNENTVKALIEF